MYWFLLTLLIDGLPGSDEPRYAKPQSATDPSYIELLESNTQVVYPALAVLTLLLIAGGVIFAWRSDEMDVEEKAELKRAVIRELRREVVHGLTADRLAKTISVERLRLLKVMEEMQRDNQLESRTDTRRRTTWHVKGVAGD